MKIAIGADHGGFELKEMLKGVIAGLGHAVDDVGCYSLEAVNYPEIGKKVVQSVLSKDADRGILICGTGIGMSMTANRYKGIRAALCHDAYTTRMSREHNDANVLCMGARVLGVGVAEDMVRIWLNTAFAGGRHACRIAMLEDL
ncbi:MAG: ribose 5-phosphate isomerase B [Dissulfuribacterales bacterium]